MKTPLKQTATVGPQSLSLLFVGEFPPSNHHGGAILLRRLLDRHSTDCLSVITSAPGIKISESHDLLGCKHVMVNTYHLPGAMKSAARMLETLSVVVMTMIEVRRKRVQTVITIVQGRYYMAAVLAAWLTATPHITIVHDNFLSRYIGPSGPLRSAKRYLTRQIIRHANHVYVVSPDMQALVRSECDISAEVQLPSTTAPVRSQENRNHGQAQSGAVILFAGLVGYAVQDCLDLLVELVKKAEQHGLAGLRLHLCTNLTPSDLRSLGWDQENVVCMGWLPHAHLSDALAGADILFLPYSFSETARDAVQTAFPSKTADYLAAGKPLLILGPGYSSLVRYAAPLGFAEIVTELTLPALARSVSLLVGSRDYRDQLAARALEVFSSDHDIAQQQDKFYATLGGIVKNAHEIPQSSKPRGFLGQGQG